MSYSVHSQFLPNWFVRNRALAIGIAFSGVGVGAILILPWLQAMILHEGWRTACWKLGLITLVVLLPINLLVAKSPESLGLLPDGERARAAGAAKKRPSNVVDAAMGRDRMDGAARHPHRPLLVAGAQLLRRRLDLVLRADPPDQVPGRDRLRPDAGRLVARRRGDGRHPGPDRARRAQRPHRPRDRLDAELPRASSICYVALLVLAQAPFQQ